MSRGHGPLQKAILDLVHASATPTTFETLRWTIWEEKEGVRAAEKLPTSWNTSFSRAFKSLAGSSGDVGIQERQLASIPELFAHYPQKTLMSDVRSLRQSLLGPVIDWADKDGPGPRYTPAKNERFHLEHEKPKQLESLRNSWSMLRPKLVALLPSLGDAESHDLFLLIAKGKSIFDTYELESRRSFSELLAPCLSCGSIPPPLDAEVSALSEAILPRQQAGFLRIKSYVHALSHVERHGRCRLKDETVDFLDRSQPDVVHSLPGYEAPPEQPKGRGRRSQLLWLQDQRATQSEQLHSLFDHSVFRKFQFISSGRGS